MLLRSDISELLSFGFFVLLHFRAFAVRSFPNFCFDAFTSRNYTFPTLVLAVSTVFAIRALCIAPCATSRRFPQLAPTPRPRLVPARIIRTSHLHPLSTRCACDCSSPLTHALSTLRDHPRSFHVYFLSLAHARALLCPPRLSTVRDLHVSCPWALSTTRNQTPSLALVPTEAIHALSPRALSMHCARAQSLCPCDSS